MRRVMLSCAAVMLVALMPVAAAAQETELEFETELGAVEDAVDGASGETVEEWDASRTEVAAALDALKAAAADLDYAELDAAIADLEAAIAAGDLEEIQAAADVLAPAVAALRAQAEAAAGDGTAQPTAVNTGAGVDGGPNVGLLGVAGLLALLAGGAWVLRPKTARR